MTLRRLVLAGIAAALPGAVLQTAHAQMPPSSSESFTPPERPSILTRTLRRALRDGKEIVAERRYALRFEPLADGYQVFGTLLDSRVDAPAQLAVFAQIERNRGDGGFVLQLDQHGQIMAGRTEDGEATRAKLAAAARQAIAQAAAPRAEKQQIEGVLGQLLEGKGATAFPADLFNPRASQHRESRRVALPEGGEGEVEVQLVAEAPTLGASSRRYARTVITTLAGQARVSREDYLLSTE